MTPIDECEVWKLQADAYAAELIESQIECLRVRSLMVQVGEALRIGVYGSKQVTMEQRKSTLLSAIEAYETEIGREGDSWNES